MIASRPARWKPILAAAAAALFVAVVGGTLTDTGPWYQLLRKPGWQPPDWLFGPAWTLIFALTALAAAEAWRHARTRPERDAVIAVFVVNGFLNVLWSLLFFRLQRPDWALIEVAALWLSIVAAIIVSRRHSATAAWLLAPYLLWVSFAAVLNAAVVRLNAPFG
jgi:translocator protein